MFEWKRVVQDYVLNKKIYRYELYMHGLRVGMVTKSYTKRGFLVYVPKEGVSKVGAYSSLNEAKRVLEDVIWEWWGKFK